MSLRTPLLLLTLALVSGAPAAQAPVSTLRVAGLTQPVEILRDRWGINHIYAQNEADLFFAQGYSAARDRLFQFELWRRQATGTTAEVFGTRELKRDIGARLHQFRGDMKQELGFYHPRGEQIVNAFVQGVNAYIGETERNPSLLPVEFSLLGLKPERWTPEVVISRHQGLLANIGQELTYARAVRAMGAEKVRQLAHFQGGEPVLTPDAALDLAAIPDNVLELYEAFRGSLKFAPEQIAADQRNRAAALDEERDEPDPLDIGSNN